MNGGREDEGGGCGPGPRRYLSSCCRHIVLVVSSLCGLIVVPSFCVLIVVSSCIVVVVRTSFVVGVSCCDHGGCGVVWSSCGGMVVVFMG